MAATCAPGTSVVLQPKSPAQPLLTDAGYRVVSEGFCDRACNADGTLMERTWAGSLYADPEAAVTQALSLALESAVAASDGTILDCAVDTLCIHGDSPGALAMALAVRQALSAAGVVVAPGVHT